MKLELCYSFHNYRLGYGSTIYRTDDGRWWVIRVVTNGAFSQQTCDTLHEAFAFAGMVSSEMIWNGVTGDG